MRPYLLATILAAVAAVPAGPGVARAPYGTMADGTPIEAFTLTNGRGVEVRAIEFGAIIVAIQAPDRRGRAGDIVLGFDTLDSYVAKNAPHFGAVVGRYANRIAKGRFTLDGREYRLATNNGPNHLHGGLRGFDKVAWTGEPAGSAAAPAVAFTYTSRDGEEGYPGTVQARVTYTLTDRDELVVDYHATSDKPTPINLSQHSYFNLSGGERDILGHELTIDADRYTPVDETLIPTGELAPVDGTPFDFRKPTAIGARIDAKDRQLAHGRGYDHNFVLNRRTVAGDARPSARLADPVSGRTLEIATTEPGLQFYSGNFLDGSITGKNGRVYARRWGLCLETQHFPDSPNHPSFPSTVLRPGEQYTSQTTFRFGVIR